MNIAFVPVRGGSKSIPEKNIKIFCGKPLVFWVLNELEKSNSIDKIFVSTDSGKIKTIVESFSFKKVTVVERSPTTSHDKATTESAILEFLNKDLCENRDTFLLVQATSPFTRSSDFEKAIAQFNSSDSDSLLTCVRSKRYYWDESGNPINYDYKNRKRRQDFSGIFLENGAFYISKVSSVKENKNRLSGSIEIYEMDHFTDIEIDEPHDWIIAEGIMYEFILKPKALNQVKVFLSDVDGTLTDGSMYYDEEGRELKRFNTHDGKGFELLRDNNIVTGLLTGEDNLMVDARAKKIQAKYYFKGLSAVEKVKKAKEICLRENIGFENLAYVGDDVNCIPLLEKVGVAACPLNSNQKVKQVPGIIRLNKQGGDGAVREFVDLILQNK